MKVDPFFYSSHLKMKDDSTFLDSWKLLALAQKRLNIMPTIGELATLSDFERACLKIAISEIVAKSIFYEDLLKIAQQRHKEGNAS